MNEEHKSYVIITNISKKSNVFQIISASAAYGMPSIIVGMDKIIKDLRQADRTKTAEKHQVDLQEIETIESNDGTLKDGDLDTEASKVNQFRPVMVNIGHLQHPCLFMDTLSDVKSFCNHRSIAVIGLEICAGALSLSTFTFPDSVAIMPGNEGTGLSSKQRDIVDIFLYIPQCGNGIESLNVTVATTILLHEYTTQKRTSMA